MSTPSVFLRDVHPVIGELHPLPVNFGTGFDEFVTPTMRGLARVRGREIDFLALDATSPGHGDCGRLLADCMAAYEQVSVWEIFNAELHAMLTRRGFVPVSSYEGAVRCEGLRWVSVPTPSDGGR